MFLILGFFSVFINIILKVHTKFDDTKKLQLDSMDLFKVVNKEKNDIHDWTFAHLK